MSTLTDRSCASSGPSNARPRSGCLDPTRTQKPLRRRCRTIRRPRKPVPPKTVTTRLLAVVMAQVTPTSPAIGPAIQRIEDPIDLARHDKIVLVQSLDLLGA